MDKIIYEKVGERLKRARELRRITLEEAGKKVDVHKSTILRWENGETEKFKISTLEILANFYNVNPTWLMGYDVPMQRNFDSNIQAIDNKSDGSAVVLIYGTIPAGTPMEMIEDIIGTEEIPIEYLKGDKEYFGLKIKGNSMETKYLDGDIIICEKVDDCESGKDAVVMVNGYDGTFKRIFKDPEKQTIRLQPLNTSLDAEGKPLYEAKTYTKEEIEKLPVKIIGRAIEVRRKL